MGHGVDLRSIELGRRALRAVQAVAIALVLFKFVHLMAAGIFQDEAYYWMWGQHPALSYYDHPPLNAWLLGLSSALFGWNVFALRLPVALSFLADIAAILLLSRQLAGENWQPHFWVTLLLFVATPIFWIVSSVALPDHLLLTFTLFSLLFFIRFFAARERGEGGQSRDLYVGALLLGVAALSKYNAAFLGIAVVLYVGIHDRALLRQGRLYLAGVLAILVQAPVIAWNLMQHFASWGFILHGRHAGLTASFDALPSLALGIVLFVSPFLFIPIGRFVIARRDGVPGLGFARLAFLASSLGIVAIALTTQVLFHWNLVAYAAMLPFLAFFLKPRWLLWAQAAYGVLFAGLAFVNFAVTPLTQVDAWRDEATAWSYGWGPTAAKVAELEKAHPVGFVAAADYTTASLLGFAMHDRDVVSLSARTDAFDYWFDAPAHAGEDAILFGDRWRPLSKSVIAQFTSVEPLDTLEVVVDGKKLDTHRLYLGKGFRPNS
jgi:4-amino-4-deoxy-L-arabinose transferase-like glycosyltransferase